MPQVSIILPVYNGERYIREALESIRNQTFTDWELIIVNDCSTDGTSSIIQEYAKWDGRIRIMDNDRNRKLPCSLNKGFSAAKGKFLTWTSDDNIYLPGAVEAMYRFLKENEESVMVCADMEYIDDNGNVTRTAKPYDDKNICLSNLVGGCFMYRRVVWKEVGKYDEDMFLVEDYDYWLRIKKRYGRIDHISVVLYRYREHHNSLSDKKQKEVRMQLTKLREKNIDFILCQLENRKLPLCLLYYELLETRCCSPAVDEKIFSKVPELKCEAESGYGRKKYIIFGAGFVGEQAVRVLGDRAAYLADNDRRKTGQTKWGLEILEFEKVKELAESYCVLIAVTEEKAYGLMRQLKENGITDFCTWRFYRIKEGDKS